MENAQRINLYLSSRLSSDLAEIADDLGISRTEVIRRALVLMKVAWRATAADKQLAVTSDGKRVETLIVGIGID